MRVATHLSQLRLRAAIGLSILLAAAPDLIAADPQFIGPVRVRDLSPISMLRLDFVPAHACSDDPSLSVLRVNYSDANVFMVSGTVESYLETRRQERGLTASDVNALLKQQDDFFIFDAEVAVADVEYIRALSKRTQVRLEWPLISRGGGFLDHTIEQFHSSAGLGSADRDVIDRNDVNIVARMDGRTFALTGRGTHVAPGDPTVSLQHSFPLGTDADVILEAAAKIALGGERGYFSSGASDLGVQVSAERRFSRNAFYGGISFVRVGEGHVFHVFRLSNSPSVIGAWERRMGAATWLITQTTWSRETLKPATRSPLDEDRIQITAGVRRRVGHRAIATFALTENIVHFKNTPDIGVHVSLAWFLNTPENP